LIEAEALARLGLRPGEVKENVTVRGVELMGLAPGTRVALGTAEVEITDECRPCTRMDEIRPGLMQDLDGRRGMLAKVLRAGRVRPGDPVEVLKGAEPRVAG
jgi:MOSC domain-containing protein YiiM